MNFDHPESGCNGPFRGGLERGNDLADARVVQRNWPRAAVVDRDWAGTHHRPAALFRSEDSAAFPGRVTTGLSPGMSQLDTRHGPLRMNKSHDARQRLDVLLAPDTHVARRDSPLARHGGR